MINQRLMTTIIRTLTLRKGSRNPVINLLLYPKHKILSQYCTSYMQPTTKYWLMWMGFKCDRREERLESRRRRMVQKQLLGSRSRSSSLVAEGGRCQQEAHESPWVLLPPLQRAVVDVKRSSSNSPSITALQATRCHVEELWYDPSGQQ